MAQQNKQSQFQQPSPRTTIISVVLFMLVAFFVGQQFLNMSSAGAKPTDRLITSEFVQAVEQDRATKVVYNAGDYTVSGSYYPAITAGSTGALLWAKQIIGRLGVFEAGTLEAWYDYFRTGEAGHFFTLMGTLPPEHGN